MLIIKNGVAYRGIVRFCLNLPSTRMTRFWRNHIGEHIVVILRDRE